MLTAVSKCANVFMFENAMGIPLAAEMKESNLYHLDL